MNTKRFRPLLIRLGISGISFGVTLLLFLLMNAVYRIFPCGANSIVWCDMEQQAVPLLVQLRQLWQAGESIAFSPYDAGGMHFYAVFFFFLSNPLSLLSVLSDIPADQLVTLFVVLKLALAAATATFWFRGRIPALPAAMQVLLGVMYGCSGYGMFYYQNLMWLDVMILLPLLMFSMRRMLKKTDPVPYVIVISAMVILNFYVSYMIVLFVILYMAVSVRTTVPAARKGSISARFLLASLTAACLTAFVWLPCLIQVMQSARGIGLHEVLRRTVLFDHLGDKIAMLGCTTLGFAALPLLWQKKTPRISSRRRDRRIFLLLMFAVMFDPINVMWHGGSYQAFPLRWGMIPILLMLTLAGKQLAAQFDDKKTVSVPKLRAGLILGGSMAAVFGLGLYLHFCRQTELYSYVNSLWVSTEGALWLLLLTAAAVTAYAILIAFRQHRVISARVCTILAAVMFAGGFAFSFDCYIGAAANPDTLFAETMNTAGAVQPKEDTARLRLTKKYAHANMIGAAGYPTLAHYTSLTREDYLSSIKRLGYSSYWMEVSSTGGTLISDAVWNVQYQMGLRQELSSWAEPVWTDHRLTIGYNSHVLPSALYCDAEPDALRGLPDGSRIAVQEYLAETLLGMKDAVQVYQPTSLTNVTLSVNEAGETVCKRIDPSKPAEIRYSVFIPSHQVLYFDLYSQTGTELHRPFDESVTVFYNGVSLSALYPQENNNGILTVGEPDAQYIVVRAEVHKDFVCESFGLFGMSPEDVTAAIDKAKGTELHYRDGVYSADCETSQPETLLLSAAYDEGFSAEVDGRPAEVLRLNGCQLGVQIPKGKSRVVLRYHIPGMLPALILLGCGAVFGLLLLLLRKKIPAGLRGGFDRISAVFLQIGYGVLLLFVYLFPMALWLLMQVAEHLQ